MLLLRRTTLWVGCSLLALGYAAAENFTGATGQELREAATPEEQLGNHWLSGYEQRPAAESNAELGAAVSVITAPQQRRTAALQTSERSRKLRRVCRVTAYCDRGLTAGGTRAGVGQCAAPEDIPFGTKVYIPALKRSFVVTDRTHPRFRRNTVDIFLPTEGACRRFGCRYLECEFTLPAELSVRGRPVPGVGS